METDIVVKPEPVWLVDDETILAGMKTEQEPLNVSSFESESMMQDITSSVPVLEKSTYENPVQIKEELSVSSNLLSESSEGIKIAIDVKEYNILEDTSESNLTCKVSANVNGQEHETNNITMYDKTEQTTTVKKLSYVHNHTFAVHAATSEKLLKCDLCSMWFAHSDHLMKHMRIHTGDELFKCELDELKIKPDSRMFPCIKSESNMQDMMRYNQVLEESTFQNPTEVKKEVLLSPRGFNEYDKEIKPEITFEEHNIMEDISVSTVHCQGSGSINGAESRTWKITSCDETEQGKHVKEVYEREELLFVVETNELKDKQYECNISEKQFNCDLCSKCFTTVADVAKHVRTHTGEKPFKCKFCGKCCSHYNSLKVHVRIHTREKPFKCQVCSKCFNSSSHLTRHVRTHITEKRFKCEVCSKCFTQSDYLSAHMKTHAEKKTHIREKNIKCDVCSKCFTYSSDVVTHMRTHTGDKPFKCEACDKSFKYANNLTAHKRTHTGDKPFKCEVCDKSFTYSGAVAKHMRTHTREKPFKCDVCNKSFASSCHVSRHMTTHTGYKPFKCDVCSKCFPSSSDLTRHMRTHTREKPFKCEVCSKCFTNSGTLAVHKRTHTG